MAKAEKKTFQTLDIWLSSFLSLYGIHPNLELSDGKVIFVFPISDNLYKLMANYTSNMSVPVADFVTQVKVLRGQMLTMRNQG
jgi:hypothetical protein